MCDRPTVLSLLSVLERERLLRLLSRPLIF